MAINSFLAKIGTSEPVEPYLNLDDLIKSFDISKYSKAPTNYDVEELQKLNSKFIHHMQFNIAKVRLNSFDVPLIDEKFWNVIHGNIDKISDVKIWYDVCYGEVIKQDNLDQDFLDIAANLLRDIAIWDESTWDIWINKIKENTDKKGKDLFLPLRMALTGKESGPEMKLLLPIIRREKVIGRLQYSL